MKMDEATDRREQRIAELEERIATIERSAQSIARQMTEVAVELSARMDEIAARHGVKILLAKQTAEFSRYNPAITYEAVRELPYVKGEGTDDARIEVTEASLIYFCAEAKMGMIARLIQKDQEDAYNELVRMTVFEELSGQRPTQHAAMYIVEPGSDGVMSVSVDLATRRMRYSEMPGMDASELTQPDTISRMRDKSLQRGMALYLVRSPSQRIRLELLLQHAVAELARRYQEAAETAHT
jgi:hypothetical protein